MVLKSGEGVGRGSEVDEVEEDEEIVLRLLMVEVAEEVTTRLEGGSKGACVYRGSPGTASESICV